MQPETKFKNQILRWFKKLRADGKRIWWVKLNDRTTEGLPDLLIVVNGQVIFAELKVTTKPTPLQAHTINKIIAAGGTTCFVYPDTYHLFQHMVLKFLRKEVNQYDRA